MAHSHRKKITIAVDAMGGDEGAAEVVRAARLALRELPDNLHMVLVGKGRMLERIASKANLPLGGRITIHPATQVITMEDKPVDALKKKKDSSMVQAIELVRAGTCDAAVSCGNTGALMACGTIRLRPLPGVERPSLAPTMPGIKHHFVLTDGGANPNPSALHLVHQAILGAEYARAILGKHRPKVALLNIGTEESKGNDLVLETHKLMKQLDGVVNYIGFIEGFTVFSNDADVVVTDGFTGNVLLKTCEGLLKTLKVVIEEGMMRIPVRQAFGLLSQGVFMYMKEQMDPDRYGGAPLLRLNGCVLKAHGSSNCRAMMDAIRTAMEMVEHDIKDRSIEAIGRANKILTPQGE